MLKPFFPFFGSKWRSAKLYPAPGRVVIEPFAGSAGYSCWWEPPTVLLADPDPYICGVWSYLIRVSPREILRLPDLAPGASVLELRLPQEARWLIGYWINRGSAVPKQTQSRYSTRTDRGQLVWSVRARERIASQVDRIRHWRIREREYWQYPNMRHTWYIDPPYADKGRHYRYNAIDYPHLAGWCRSRRGRVIVCEQAGAQWLPFRPLATIKSTKGTSAEVVWTRNHV
jgi:hypothetical protein